MNNKKALSFALCVLLTLTAIAVSVPVNVGDEPRNLESGFHGQPLEQPEILIAWRESTREADVFKVLFMYEDPVLEPIMPINTTYLGDHKTLKVYRAENPPFVTELALVERLVSGNSFVRVQEFTYNRGVPIIPRENHYHTEFKESGTGDVTHMHQNIHLEQGYKMNTQYQSSDGMTKVEYNQEGERKVGADFYNLLSAGVVTFSGSMQVIFICYDFFGGMWWHDEWPTKPWPSKPRDSDHDGLYDCAERYFYNTDPKKADSDGDQWRDGHEVWNTKTDLTVKNERYAILISGGIDKCSNFARYWNDLQFMYAVLLWYNYTDDNGMPNMPAHSAGFTAAQAAAGDHIITLYANGLPWNANNNNTPDATCPASGWHPGGGGYHNETGEEGETPVDLEQDVYRGTIDYPVGKDKNPTHGPKFPWGNMPIDFSATKANLQTVINVLSNVMTARDFLFILASNHGSGYYNKGGVSFYDTGRIEVNSDENDNMKESDLVFDGLKLPNGKYYKWDLDGDSIHDDLLYNNSGTIQLLIDADDDGDRTQDAGEDWSADYVDRNGDMVIDKNDDQQGQGRNKQKMHRIITDNGADNAIGVDELLWLWGTRLDAAGNTHREKIYDDELNTILSGITAKRISVVMEPCFSGGFVSDLTAADVVLTASGETEWSWSADGTDITTGNPAQGNPANPALRGEDSFDEFTLHLIAGFWLEYPGNTGYANNVPANRGADGDSDGQISMQEAYNYAKGQDSRSETPQSTGATIGTTYL